MTPHGSGSWTDWNSHDPGVTLLEVLAYSVSDLAADIGRQVRAGKCGWRCTLVIAAMAAAAGAALLIQHRRSGLAAELER